MTRAAADLGTIVFVLVVNGKDTYAARTRVAVASIRATNPRCRVLVASDRESYETLDTGSSPLLNEVDQWIEVPTPAGNAAFRSRFIKTTLRTRIDGPFLYLDSDVVVRGSLADLFLLDCDVAGALNHSRDAFVEQVWDQDELLLKAMGWEIRRDVYINGGVLFWNETPGARALSVEWHNRWVLSTGSQNTIRDQPAFNSALMVVCPRLSLLPHRFNAQVFTAPRTAEGAVIWHFYAGDDSRIPTAYLDLVAATSGPGCVDPTGLDSFMGASTPWSGRDMEGLVAKLVELTDRVFMLQSELASSRRNWAAVQERYLAVQRDLDAAVSGEALAKAQLAAERQKVRDRIEEVASVRATINQILASRSWRLTRPLRALHDWLRGNRWSDPDSTLPDDP